MGPGAVMLGVWPKIQPAHPIPRPLPCNPLCRRTFHEAARPLGPSSSPRGTCAKAPIGAFLTTPPQPDLNPSVYGSVGATT